MLKMEESGLIDSIRRRWRKRLPQCSLPTNTAMSFEQVSTAFLALLLGTSAAVVILLGERLASSKRVAELRARAVSPNSKLGSNWTWTNLPGRVGWGRGTSWVENSVITFWLPICRWYNDDNCDDDDYSSENGDNDGINSNDNGVLSSLSLLLILW